MRTKTLASPRSCKRHSGTTSAMAKVWMKVAYISKNGARFHKWSKKANGDFTPV